jgi:hypothetical protein
MNLIEKTHTPAKNRDSGTNKVSVSSVSQPDTSTSPDRGIDNRSAYRAKRQREQETK